MLQKVIADTDAKWFEYRVNKALELGWHIVDGSLQINKDKYVVLLETEET